MKSINEILLATQLAIILRIYGYASLTDDNTIKQHRHITSLVKLSGVILGLMAAIMIISRW